MTFKSIAFLLVVLELLFVPTASAQAPNSLTAQEATDGWALLFDGKGLAGWSTSGDPKAWGVQDGELVITKPGKGWWLRTDRMYRDFELLLDFTTPKKGNSGVGLRGSTTGDPAFTGIELQILASHGEEPKVGNCGAVYGAIAPAVMAVEPPGEWNSYRVRLVGDTLDVWLNGQRVHTGQRLDERGYIHDPKNKCPLKDRLPTGYISLQDHGDPVRFRNIKIKDLSPDKDPGGFEPIFNGKNITGWKKRGEGTWKAEEGTLVGRDGPGHLFSETEYTNFEARAFVKVNPKGNSGFYFRTHPKKEDPDTWPDGYEAQVDNHDPKNFTGCIYDRAWPAVLKSPITRDNAWFDYRVRAQGDQVQTWINGVEMVQATLDNFPSGHFALQTHHKGNEIMFRDIQVRELSAPAGASGPATDPIRAAYCTESLGFRHDVLPETVQIMGALGQELDWLEVETLATAAELTPQKLSQLDVIVLYTTGPLPIDVDALVKWIEGGGALVGVHSATDTLSDDPAYVELIGGIFDGHPWNEEVDIVLNDPHHPAVAPFASSATKGPRVRLADEIYQFKSLNSDQHILMSLAPETPKAEPGRPYPLAWCREVGKGRMFYTALGHRPEVWRDKRFVDHIAAGIKWAARREP